MDKPKKRKEDIPTDVDLKGGSFSHIKISAEELRKNLGNPEVLTLVKDYFLLNKNENNISNYIEAGGSISEICQLLTNIDVKNRDNRCIIFSTLQLIIIKLITKSTKQDQLKDDCKQLISNYIGEFQALLTTKTSVKNKKIVLQLLASLAALDTGHANFILLSLTLMKNDVDSLVEHVNPLDEKSLRVAFIHFILAFLIEQSTKVIEKLLAKKVWLTSIFPGLQYDTPFTVKLVLSTLEGRVINNKDLSKTSKLYAFNTMSLTHLSELYNWNPKSWYDKSSKNTFPGQINEDDKIEIRSLIHELLLKLCTSVQHGIAFHDPTYGTSSIQKNLTISNYLQKLGQFWEDSFKRELLHKTLIACPDVLKPLLNSLQPRLNVTAANWLEILELVVQILVDMKFDLTNLDSKNYLSLVKDLIIPHQILEAITKGQLLKCTSSHEKLTTIKMLFVILNRYKNIFGRILKEDKDYYSFQKDVTAYLINNLPNSFGLLECLKQSYEREEFEAVKELTKLFTLYEQICPETVDIIRYNDTISGWVKQYVTDFESSSLQDVSLLLSMVKLEVIVNPQDAYEEKYLELFKYTTISEEETDKKLGLSILKELLYKSGIFIRNEKELSLWMYCMEKYFDTSIGSLIAASLKWAFDNTNTIYKTLLEVQEYSAVDISCGLNLDDFLKLSVNDDVSGMDTSVDSMFNLSPLLPSVLQLLSDDYFNKSDEFIIAFLVHYFHRLVTVQPYVALLKKYNCAAVEKILPYVESWLDKPICINVPLFHKSIFFNASRSVLTEKKFDYETAINSLSDRYSTELLLEECIFMACELSRLGQATPVRLEQLSFLVQCCLTDTDLQVPLNHPTFLANFHPLMDVGDSDLTTLVVLLAENNRLNTKAISPFSHRLAFELKYAKTLCYNLEDDSKLQKLLQIFKFSKLDVEDLMNHVFSMKAKYFERDGKLSFWTTMATYLLKDAVELNIVLNENNLQNLINILRKLIMKGHDTSEICDLILKYFKTLEIDLNGTLLDSVIELFVTMSTATIWHEELCVYIHHLIDKVDYSNISIERSITLLASLDKLKNRHKEVVSDSSLVIFNGLCQRPSPKWLVDLKKIIDNAIPHETCKKVCKHVKKHPRDIFTSIESLSVIKNIFIKSEEIYTLYTLATNWLSEELKKSKESFDQAQSEEMCKILTEIMTSETDLSGVSVADNEFIMHLLLEGLRLPSQPIIELLHCVVEHNLTKLPPTEIFELLTSHSCFLDVLLLKNSSAKYSCLKLMLLLLTKDSSLINSKHVPVLLSSYGATLSKMDQIILKILYMFEKVGGLNLAGWKPYVWGEAALDHYNVHSKLKTVKPSPTITLDLFQKDIVLKTVSVFPLTRKLNEKDYEKDEGNIYDPAFFLPLLSQVTTDTDLGWKLAGSGAFALTIAALASSDPDVRLAAYHVLYRIYSTLEDHKDNLIWRHFIEAIRGGIVDLNEKDNVRLSSIVTTFLARASMIMAFPGDPLYFCLHNFIFAKPHMKLNVVPAFFEMFHYTQGNQKLHQRWLLEVINDGIREQRDLQLALNCFTFKFILDYYSCNLATIKTKELIEGLVAKCIEFVDEKQLLINKYSIIPWISGAKSNIIYNLPQSVNSQYKPLIDFVKEKVIRT